MILVIIILALLLAPFPASAQTNPHDAQPQRPTVATHAGTVTPGWLEIEAGTEFDRDTPGSRGVSAPLLAKVGLGSRTHLELATSIVSPPAQTTGVDDFSVGLKWRLTENAPVIQDFAVLPSVKFATGSADIGTDTTDVGLLFISSRTIGAVAIDLNFGYTHRSGDGTVVPQDATLWTASFGGPLRNQVGWVAELFGRPGTSGPAGSDSTVAVLAGPTLAVTNWLVLDVGVIAGLTGPQPNALYAGVTYNVGKIRR